LKIDVSITGIEDVLKTLSVPLQRKIVVSTINKVASAVNTQLKREFSQTYTVTQKDMREKGLLEIKKANQYNIFAMIIGRVRGTWLYGHQGVKQTASGVSARVRKGMVSQYQHAFIATTRKGVTGVWTRTGKDRYPITPLYGVNFGLLLKSRWVMDIIDKVYAERLVNTFSHEFDWYTGKIAA
jgi:hypothetical protein